MLCYNSLYVLDDIFYALIDGLMFITEPYRLFNVSGGGR